MLRAQNKSGIALAFSKNAPTLASVLAFRDATLDICRRTPQGYMGLRHISEELKERAIPASLAGKLRKLRASAGRGTITSRPGDAQAAAAATAAAEEAADEAAPQEPDTPGTPGHAATVKKQPGKAAARISTVLIDQLVLEVDVHMALLVSLRHWTSDRQWGAIYRLVLSAKVAARWMRSTWRSRKGPAPSRAMADLAALPLRKGRLVESDALQSVALLFKAIAAAQRLTGSELFSALSVSDEPEPEATAEERAEQPPVTPRRHLQEARQRDRELNDNLNVTRTVGK